MVFLKFQGFLFASLFLAFVFLFALSCIHCLCLALICMLRSYWLVCLMGLKCIQNFQWRSFKLDIQAWNGSINLRARISWPRPNPWFYKVLKMRHWCPQKQEMNYKFSKLRISVPRLVFLKFQSFLFACSFLVFLFLFTLACIHCLCFVLICKLRSYWLVCLIGL